MANYRVAKRYAKAFMEVLSPDKMEGAVQEMKDIIVLLKQNKNLHAFFKSPIISEDKKMSVSKEIFKSFSQDTQNLIHLLIKNARIENLKEVAQSFIEQYRQKKGIRRVIVTSAHPLATEQVKSIIEKVKNNLSIESNKIEIEQKIDESLIGGFILRIDDQQFDSSIKTRLNKIRQEFSVGKLTS